MNRFGISLLAGIWLLNGCGSRTEPPSSPSPLPIATPSGRTGEGTGNSPLATTAGGGPSSAGSGGETGGGAVGSGGTDAPHRAPPSQPDSPHTRAEIDQNFQRDSQSFPAEASLNQNPSEARAEAAPKTIKAVAGLHGYDEVMEKYQPSSSFEAVETGKRLYKANCARCHSLSGAPTEIAGQTLARYAMADLSQPMRYKYGADGRGIFRSIAFGTAAPPHGMYNGVLKDQQIWNIVAYVQSLQK